MITSRWSAKRASGSWCREAVAVGAPLVLLPAGADPQLHPPAADDVHGPDHLGRQRRVAERGADHDLAEAHALGQCGQRGQVVNDSKVSSSVGPGSVVEVVEDPDRLEPEPLGLLGDVSGAPRPCADPSRRTPRSIPAARPRRRPRSETLYASVSADDRPARTRLRRRMAEGVTSTSSSAAMNSMADSRVIGRGGVKRSESSWLWVRMLVSCLDLVALTFMSPGRAFSPTIMPS